MVDVLRIAAGNGLQDEGKIGHIGLSKVTPEDIDDARQEFTVAAVQNVLNITVLRPALKNYSDLDIAYVAYRPLDAVALAATWGVAEPSTGSSTAATTSPHPQHKPTATHRTPRDRCHGLDMTATRTTSPTASSPAPAPTRKSAPTRTGGHQ
ncbi:aldo/keto reductase [Streptomyces rapamycinicus]|uniref:Aldo/keto reductase n=2 Tax=Streptomyces rapamycinicus TaxID=1226757 RepID=A0A3L8R2F2_STRRN|nr:aldo/keto reductase [Streptomyces rapamycinicus]MBB4781602.1 aryl-alcohol dehydrogenase-like predicted oxidoreductase [Streptomyces rapamycinicus]RLV73757.1 aldo/keto reductase [Streptomyces rapamycinicus NRRL 5491]UTO62189.1 aldo/keto reductase [Streptomyces rapamycinicus]UTP30141.1 aldo/keto reductase [Streptomyces rapamycinicus NRRL 5491]